MNSIVNTMQWLYQAMPPELIVLGAALACFLAVVTLVLAGRFAFVQGLGSRLAALETLIAERQKILIDVGQKLAEAEEIKQKVEYGQKRLDALGQELKPLEEKHLKALSDYEDVKGKLRVICEEWDQLRERVELYKDRIAKLDALEQEIKDLQKQRDALEIAIKELPERKNELEGIKQDIEKKNKDVEEIKNSLKQKIAEKEDLDSKISSANKTIERLKKEEQQITESTNRLKEAKIDLDARIQTLSDKLKRVGQMPPEAFDSLNVGVFPVNVNSVANLGEDVALRRLDDLVRGTGFEIPDRLQKAFHTALKTADISCLTVMAGVSGTGKSAFPKLYAQAMGMHFLPLAVEPRWDSPKDLFGFLNYMENRFEATTLGRALVQFNNASFDPGDLNGQILLVLLDEMNLARIEHYFSEFLSKLEMRRNANITREEDYNNVSVEIFAGHPGDDDIEQVDPVRLYAGDNVLFVGTMNEDESTQSLSDKVIDRANVLYFGKPTQMSVRPQLPMPANNARPLAMNAWRGWIREPNADTIPNYNSIDVLINNINTALAGLGRPFGWRTYKAIMAYVANHPDARAGGMRPLSDQIAMRVMPKLRGVDLSEHAEVINSLGTLVGQVNDSALGEAFDRARQSNRGFFDWRGIDWDR